MYGAFDFNQKTHILRERLQWMLPVGDWLYGNHIVSAGPFTCRRFKPWCPEFLNWGDSREGALNHSRQILTKWAVIER